MLLDLGFNFGIGGIVDWCFLGFWCCVVGLVCDLWVLCLRFWGGWVNWLFVLICLLFTMVDRLV